MDSSFWPAGRCYLTVTRHKHCIASLLTYEIKGDSYSHHNICNHEEQYSCPPQDTGKTEIEKLDMRTISQPDRLPSIRMGWHENQQQSCRAPDANDHAKMSSWGIFIVIVIQSWCITRNSGSRKDVDKMPCWKVLWLSFCWWRADCWLPFHRRSHREQRLIVDCLYINGWLLIAYTPKKENKNEGWNLIHEMPGSFRVIRHAVLPGTWTGAQQSESKNKWVNNRK